MSIGEFDHARIFLYVYILDLIKLGFFSSCNTRYSSFFVVLSTVCYYVPMSMCASRLVANCCAQLHTYRSVLSASRLPQGQGSFAPHTYVSASVRERLRMHTTTLLAGIIGEEFTAHPHQHSK